jgi:hypothetical protein
VKKLSSAKLADLLDAVADYVDDVELKKTASVRAERDDRISKFAERYEASTGESIPDELRNKLAGLDTNALDHLLKVAKNNNESPVALGRSADLNDDPAPRNIKEAADQSEKRFLDWLVND